MDELALLRSLIAGEKLQEGELLKLLRKAHQPDMRDVALCNEIFAGAGDVLHVSCFRQIIRADVSDETIKAWVKTRKALIERYKILLPTIFSYLSPKDSHELYYAVRRIDDFCEDLPNTISSGRRGHNLRKIIKQNDHLERVLREAKELLEKSRNDNVAFLFDEVRHGYLASNPVYDELPSFDALVSYFDFLVGSVALNRIELLEGRRGYIPANNAKFDAVEVTYDLFRISGGPALKTTPGSDFSHLASLLYELATGDRDQSMAGAVIEFRRSDERKEADQYDVEYGPERDRQLEEDNFSTFANVLRKPPPNLSYASNCLRSTMVETSFAWSIWPWRLERWRTSDLQQQHTDPS